jgi:DNA-binding ferritin-like protein
MDVIKYANYSSLGNRRRTTHRYITPIKFSRRNINKKTESTLRALKEKSETSKDPKEMLAINYIVKRLQEAYNYYKENTQVSNTTFDNTQDSIKDQIYRTAA